MSFDGIWLLFFTGPVVSTASFLIALVYWLVLRRNQDEPRRTESARHAVKVLGITALSFCALSAGIWWLLSAAVAHM